MDEIGEHRIYDTVRNAVAAASPTDGGTESTGGAQNRWTEE
jgi:hypothetical protein